MGAAGTDTLGISHCDRRYFKSLRRQESAINTESLFSPLMAKFSRAALSDTVNLNYEQYDIMAAETGLRFVWRKDSGYIGEGRKSYRVQPGSLSALP